MLLEHLMAANDKAAIITNKTKQASFAPEILTLKKFTANDLQFFRLVIY
jgi:hypothetical protein